MSIRVGAAPPPPLVRMRDSILGQPSFIPVTPQLRVTALDSGTYPMDGGGVATCREIVLQVIPHYSVTGE